MCSIHLTSTLDFIKSMPYLGGGLILEGKEWPTLSHARSPSHPQLPRGLTAF